MQLVAMANSSSYAAGGARHVVEALRPDDGRADGSDVSLKEDA